MFNLAAHAPAATPIAVTLDATALEALCGNGRFFSLTFTKRDGTTRVMTARLGVTRYLKTPLDGARRALAPTASVVTVYDVQAGGYRSIRLDSIIELRARRRRWVPAAAARVALERTPSAAEQAANAAPYAICEARRHHSYLVRLRMSPASRRVHRARVAAAVRALRAVRAPR